MPICPYHRCFKADEDYCPDCEKEGIFAISSEFDKQDRYIDTHRYLGNEFQPQKSRALLVFQKGVGPGIYQCAKCGAEQQCYDEKDLSECNACGGKKHNRLDNTNVITKQELQNLLIQMYHAAMDLGYKKRTLSMAIPDRITAERKCMYIIRRGTGAVCSACSENEKYPKCPCVKEEYE